MRIQEPHDLILISPTAKSRSIPAFVDGNAVKSIDADEDTMVGTRELRCCAVAPVDGEEGNIVPARESDLGESVSP